MYRLTVIAGPNRGTSYAAQGGTITIGRQSGNTIVFQSSKVSKLHCTIDVSDEEVTLKDNESSNGTFVNGMLTKFRKLRPGDRVSVGEYVLELNQPGSKLAKPGRALIGLATDLPGQLPGNIINHTPMNVMAGMGGGQFDQNQMMNQAPKDLRAKALWFFENRIMTIFYSLNLKHEWKILCVGIFSVFTVVNLVSAIYPLLQSNQTSLIREIGSKARFMAKQIAEQNVGFLAARAETKTDLGIVENAPGVKAAFLVDLDNRILAPGAKLNQYLANGTEAVIATRGRDAFRNGQETGFYLYDDVSSLVVAVEPVKVLSPTLGKNIVVAMAVVSIDSALSTPDIGEMGLVYSEALILAAILGGLMLIILYRLTLNPFETLNEDMNQALKGDINQVPYQFKLDEVSALWDLINSAIQRIPKAGDSGGGGSAGGILSSSIDEFLGPLKMLGGLLKFGLIVFDQEQKIVFLNPAFEEISGIRLDAAVGHAMTEVARDEAMGMFTNDIIGRAPVGGDGISEEFEFSGVAFKMYAAAFGTPGNVARCFLLAAVKPEAE